MTDAYLVIQTVGFATGAALFVLLVALSYKTERLKGENFSGTVAAALGLLWNFGNLVKYASLMAGFGLLPTG